MRMGTEEEEICNTLSFVRFCLVLNPSIVEFLLILSVRKERDYKYRNEHGEDVVALDRLGCIL